MPGQVELVSAYLAGADLPEEEAVLHDRLSAAGWARRITVGNDTLALLRCGAPERWGVAVVCGAGINAIGVAPDGRIARFPALGELTGDWGGGDGLMRTGCGQRCVARTAAAVPPRFERPHRSGVRHARVLWRSVSRCTRSA